MKVWRPSTVVRGGTRWVESQPGRWVDLGKLTGPELVKWCFLHKVPLPCFGPSVLRAGR